MKKILSILSICGLIICIVISGCEKQAVVESINSGDIVSQFMSNDILVTITTGADVLTKGSSESECEYYTVTGELNNTKYSTYVERKVYSDGLSISSVFSQDGEWLFSETYFNEELINSEFAELNDPVIETKGSRRPGERYKECVQRVHESIKRAAEENNPVICDLIGCCGAVAAVCGIIDCSEYGTQF